MTKKYKHFIFDFDGVIANSRAIACEEINNLVSKYYPTIPSAKTQEDLALIYCGCLKNSLLRFGLSQNECENFFNQHSTAMQKRCQEIEPFYKVVQLIEETLPQRCSIVTSCYSQAVQNILSKAAIDIEKTFLYLKGREFKQSKTQKILDILAEMRISVEETVYIGDLVSDILYCRKVPIDIAVVGFGYHPISYLSAFDPDYCLESQEDLKKFILNKAQLMMDNELMKVA